MKLLISSHFPFNKIGYSTQTKEIVKSILNLYSNIEIGILCWDGFDIPVEDKFYTLDTINHQFYISDEDYKIFKNIKFFFGGKRNVNINNQDQLTKHWNIIKKFVDYFNPDKLLVYQDIFVFETFNIDLIKCKKYLYLPIHSSFCENSLFKFKNGLHPELKNLQFLPYFNKIATPSKFGIEVLKRYNYKDSKLIKHIVNVPIVNKSKSELRKQYNLEDDVFICLIVAKNGETNDRKSLLEQFEAFGKFQKNKNCKLIFHESQHENLTSGAINLEPIVQKYNMRNKIKLTDYNIQTSIQIAELYKLSDVLLCASKSEGFGLPMVEAQIQGLKVISNNCTSMPDNTHWGVCVEPKFITEKINNLNSWSIPDTNKISEVLNDFYNNNLNKYNLKPINTKNYSSEIIGNQWLDFLEIGNINNLKNKNSNDDYNNIKTNIMDNITNYLQTQSTELQKTKFNFKYNHKNNKIAIIIEPRKHSLLQSVVYNIMSNLGSEWNLQICSYDLNYVENLFLNSTFKWYPLSKNNLTPAEYNKMLMSKNFWNLINEEHILIFQTDSMILNKYSSNDLNYFMNFDYIGGIYWNKLNLNYNNINICYTGFTNSPKRNFSICGGFTYRKKRVMLDCLEKVSVKDIIKYRKQYCMNTHFYNEQTIGEDIYFQHACELLDYNLPYLEDCDLFCENLCTEQFNKKSFGIHNLKKHIIDNYVDSKNFKKYFDDNKTIIEKENKLNLISSYSQLKQDLKVLEFYKYKKNGFFIDIGANDGINLSNTYLLEKNYNWNGICIEPLPSQFNKLKNNRKCICVNKALYNKSNKIVKFLDTSNSKDKLGLYSGILDNFDKSLIDTHFKNCNTINVNTINFNDLKQKYNIPKFVDYLSIDTEGSEYEILSTIDYNNTIFGIIHVEHNYKTKKREKIKKLLLSNNYIYNGENKWDDIYIYGKILKNVKNLHKIKTKQELVNFSNKRSSKTQFVNYDDYINYQVNFGMSHEIDCEKWSNGQRKCIRENFQNLDRTLKILDICCGDGVGLCELTKMGFHDLTGVEICDEKIVNAKQFCPIIKMDICCGPFDLKDKYDIIYSSHTIEHVLHPEYTIYQIAQFLKDDGTFFLILPYPDIAAGNPLNIGRYNIHCGIIPLKLHINDEAKSLCKTIEDMNLNIIDKKFKSYREPEIHLTIKKKNNYLTNFLKGHKTVCDDKKDIFYDGNKMNYYGNKFNTDKVYQNNKYNKIIDCFIFYNELDMLEFRLNYLYNSVDYFVLVESTFTFKGNKKKLYYKNTQKRFEKYQDKIIHIMVEDMPNTNNAWDNEKFQRKCIDRGLSKLNLTNNDIIIVSDLDEIIDRDTLSKITNVNGILNLQQDMYYYNIETKQKNKWNFAKILDYKTYCDYNKDCSVIRLLHLNYKLNCVDKGGWHFSYFGNIDFIKNKIKNFSHQEFNKKEYLNKIKDKVKEGKDLFGRENEFIIIKVEENTYLPENYQKYNVFKNIENKQEPFLKVITV